jgi:hypothetical protein
MQTMLITFFDIKGTVHLEVIPQGLSTKLIMRKQSRGYVKLWLEKGLNFVQMNGLSTMKILHLTRRSLSSSF